MCTLSCSFLRTSAFLVFILRFQANAAGDSSLFGNSSWEVGIWSASSSLEFWLILCLHRSTQPLSKHKEITVKKRTLWVTAPGILGYKVTVLLVSKLLCFQWRRRIGHSCREKQPAEEQTHECISKMADKRLIILLIASFIHLQGETVAWKH